MKDSEVDVADKQTDQESNTYDLAIVGGGPAGLAAGIYAGRSRLNTILFDMTGGGGQMNIIDRVENYPGVLDLESGAALADIMRRQMESFGVSITFDQIEQINTSDNAIALKGGASSYRVKTLLLSSGARHRPLGVPGEGRLMGRGVSVCATCDGPFFKGKHVAVVGGGDSAVMEAVYLTRVVSHVTLIHRRDRLRAERLLQERIFSAPNVDFLWNTVVEEILGEESVRGIRLKNLTTQEESMLSVDAVFVFVGLLPNTEFVKECVELDEFGFVKTDQRMRTSHPRIFAAGDIRSGTVRQIGTAVGDGITAAVTIQELLDSDTPPRAHLKTKLFS